MSGTLYSIYRGYKTTYMFTVIPTLFEIQPLPPLYVLRAYI